MRLLVMVALVAMVGSAAAKGVKKKPTKAQAIEAATKWAAALEGGEAQPLTAAVFTARIHDDGPTPEPCGTAVAKDPAAIGKLLECARQHAPMGSEFAAVTSLKKNVPYLMVMKKDVTDAMTKTTLVFHHEQCAGQGDDVAIAVIFDDDEKVKVSGLYYASEFCGE